MNDYKVKISKKIVALLAKTMDSGCSEHEAMSAAAMASKLMLEYDLSTKDISEIEDEEFLKKSKSFAKGSSKRRYYHPVQFIVSAISRFTTTKSYIAINGDLVFFGTDKDVSIAHYMVDICKNAMDHEYNKYKISPEKPKGVHGKTLRASFMRGMSARLVSRFDKMSFENECIHRKSTGSDLVVLKNQLVEKKFKIVVGKLSKSYSQSYHGNNNARNAGHNAANNVNLNSGISNSNKNSLRLG